MSSSENEIPSENPSGSEQSAYESELEVEESVKEPVDTSEQPQLSLEKPKEAEGNPPIVNSNVPG